MRKSSFILLLSFIYLAGCAQTESRITISSISPSENTGQDYSSWLNDDITSLVPNCWTPSNFKYIDVILQLESKTKITRLSLYDYQGVFTDNPASIYALNGTQKTLIGRFTGEQYQVFTDMVLATPLIADALIIHKYCNNIPQKIEIFGFKDYSGAPGPQLPVSVIKFDSLYSITLGDTPFKLVATSNNTQTPVTFTSSNPAVVAVAFTGGSWLATITGTGAATITAAQAGNANFVVAQSVPRILVVNAAGTLVNGKIPIDAKRWFQLTNASNGLDGLFDGKTNVEVLTGWGKVLDNYDSYYPVLNGEQIDLTGVRMYDGSGTNSSQPMKLSVVTNSGQKILVSTFTGAQYFTWTGPDPNNPAKYDLPAPLTNIKYLVINSWNFFPTEIEFFGSYKAGKPVTPAVKKTFPLHQMFGVNGFEWNFEDPNSPGQIDNVRFKAAKSFTGLRHYMDWEKLELSQGSYTYNPTLSGGWNYDVLYDSCKAAGIEVLACLKTLPGWMLNSYPADQRDWENVPLKYGRNFSDPKSYLEQARVAFQYAARYGSNKNVNKSLLSVNSTPRWSGDKVNTIKVGLGTVKYIECDNERDKWWKGRKGYQTAYEYAANLSAFYDGNKNTMGPGVGVKNADPNMKVVMAGNASATTDYVEGMVDWCRKYRGYNTDGTVNLCWDVINYHYYSNDSWSSQNGNATRGAAPEISGASQVAAEFIQAAHLYANDMPVWLTELGYDLNQGSPFKAIPIGSKTALQTEADWILRSSLLYARTGVERIFFYELYDDNLSNPLQFSSSGLINADKTRKPAADYIYQANKLIGQYVYQQTINGDPIVDHYKLNGNSAYVIVVPDEKGRTAQYTLDIGNAGSAKIYKPKAGSDNMDVQTVTTANGKLIITATETPLFVIPQGGGVLNKMVNMDSATQHIDHLPVNATSVTRGLENSIHLYPNPVADFINVTISNDFTNNVTVKISEAASGKVFKNIRFNKPGGYLSQSINIKSLPEGYFMIEVTQGNNKVIKKILKTAYSNFVL